MTKKSLSIHQHFYSGLLALTSQQRGDVLGALINSAQNTEKTPLDANSELIYQMIKVQQERISLINSNNSKGHGAPAGNQNATKTNETIENKRNNQNKRNLMEHPPPPLRQYGNIASKWATRLTLRNL
jgi:hypothetical protein